MKRSFFFFFFEVACARCLRVEWMRSVESEEEGESNKEAVEV